MKKEKVEAVAAALRKTAKDIAAGTMQGEEAASHVERSAKLLESLVSESRNNASAENGKKGGRPAKKKA